MRADGRVCRYEVDGRRLLHVINWQHQKINRPTRSVLAPCPHHERGEYEKYRKDHAEVVSIHGGLTESSVSGTGVVSEGSPHDLGSKGAREQGTRATDIGNRLLDEHIKAMRNKPPRDVAQKTGTAIDKLVTEGIEPRWIAAGLALMREKPQLGPPLLASLVNQAMNAPTRPADKRFNAAGAYTAWDA
jgi:hypothetical protein